MVDAEPFTPFGRRRGARTRTTLAETDARPQAACGRRPTAATPPGRSPTCKGWLGDGWRVVLVTEGHGPAERLVEVLRGAGRRRPGSRPTSADRAGAVGRARHDRRLDHGFVAEPLRARGAHRGPTSPGSGPSTKDMRRMPSPAAQHGRPAAAAARRLRRARAARRRPLRRDGAAHRAAARPASTWSSSTPPSKRGQPGDRLFVPTDQLDQVTRYVGGEAPSLHRLGGADWQKTKGRARKAVKEIAAELIRLYSARMAAPGHAFGPDTPVAARARGRVPVRRDARTSWPRSTRSRRDMEKPIPMDRLICGDVGYGKTEIAVRAAFKAVQDGKQVAVLVPTTLLVQQHFATFTERYANFPVDRQGAVAVPDRQGGRGGRPTAWPTARSTSSSAPTGCSPATVQFKDLGLVIVDEEQRFGVEHKEHLKQLRTNVDVLTMSATPIPRTLEMAVTGIREMSTIATPPEERHPVLTFVGPYDEKQIAAAIRRELLREGQVFYIHNRVESIERAAARLRELVPEARIAVAHGQMNEHAARAGHRRLLGEASSTSWSARRSSRAGWTSPTPTR